MRTEKTCFISTFILEKDCYYYERVVLFDQINLFPNSFYHLVGHQSPSNPPSLLGEIYTPSKTMGKAGPSLKGKIIDTSRD